MIEYKIIQCPYCGEMIDVPVDISVAVQDYIEDCAVCCRPIEMSVVVAGDDIAVRARTNDE